jgi:hypothetical protein
MKQSAAMIRGCLIVILLFLVYMPFQTKAEECDANVAAESSGKVTTFRFTVGYGCPEIYGFYVIPTDNVSIDVKSSPKGWTGGGVKHDFVIWVTGSNPVYAGETSGEFIANFSRADSHELNWSVADVGLIPVDWGHIVLEQ